MSWLDLGDGEGWHPPQPISDPVTRPGAPIAMARQTSTVLTSLFFDANGRLTVAWLDLSDGKGWHEPVAFSDAVAQPGADLAMAKQSDSVLAALFVDAHGKLNVSWLDLNDGQPWHKPVAFSDPFARPGTPIAMAKQAEHVLTALLFDSDGRLDVSWLDLDDHQSWHKPQAISDIVAPPAAHVAMAKQSDTVLTGLFFDRDGRLDVAWLDLADHQPWHKPQPISDRVAPPGAHIAMARQTDTVLAALFVGTDQKLQVAWLDLADQQPWHKPQPISGVVAPPGAAVALAKQSDQVLTALFVDLQGRLEVAWVDLSDGLGWHAPVVISPPVAPPGAHVAMERQSP